MNKYTKLEKCRVCKNKHIQKVLDLGEQELTGIFPKSKEEKVTKGPLHLVWCNECGLLQLGHSYCLEEMYGENYGYRSGLNKSMVKHLSDKVYHLERIYKPKENDIVLDIGSNDATTLKAYQTKNLRKIGIDPTGEKFKEYYTNDIQLISDFFSATNYKKIFGEEKAKIITSISMFYDLESPIDFVRDIESVLDDEGIWHFEQSYMPSMLRLVSYDTVCHEHLEYYSLGVIKYILEKVGMKIIDVGMYAINGGSFAVTAVKKISPLKPNDAVIKWLLEQEDRMGIKTIAPYKDFEQKVLRHRADLRRLINALVRDGKRVMGYGASTKGNVILQYCDLNSDVINAIAEVNIDKFGSFTPQTLIPIVSEKEAKEQNPDYFIVLPWHFKNGILEREQEFLDGGGKMIFPFPEIEIV
ncbi:MAG: class I SAM-dependent methyltransferase [bacterium]